MITKFLKKSLNKIHRCRQITLLFSLNFYGDEVMKFDSVKWYVVFINHALWTKLSEIRSSGVTKKSFQL